MLASCYLYRNTYSTLNFQFSHSFSFDQVTHLYYTSLMHMQTHIHTHTQPSHRTSRPCPVPMIPQILTFLSPRQMTSFTQTLRARKSSRVKAYHLLVLHSLVLITPSLSSRIGTYILYLYIRSFTYVRKSLV